jgi:hypothetical protein
MVDSVPWAANNQIKTTNPNESISPINAAALPPIKLANPNGYFLTCSSYSGLRHLSAGVVE